MTELDLQLRKPDDTPPDPFAPLGQPAAEKLPEVESRPGRPPGGAALFLAELAVAFLWLYDGLWCKLLRGCASVDAVLAALPAPLFARANGVRLAVGVVEIVLALWVLSRAAPRLAAMVQALVLVGLTLAAFRFAPAYIGDPGRLVAETVVFLALIFLVASRRA